MLLRFRPLLLVLALLVALAPLPASAATQRSLGDAGDAQRQAPPPENGLA